MTPRTKIELIVKFMPSDRLRRQCTNYDSTTAIMGGPNLEILKFSIYLFVPIVALIHFGDPQWYREKVVPVRLYVITCFQYLILFTQYRNQLFPEMDRTVQV